MINHRIGPRGHDDRGADQHLAFAQVFSTLPRLAWGSQLFGPQLLTDDMAIRDIV